MLWSLIKIVVFVALVAALALGAGYLLESTGGFRSPLRGWNSPLARCNR